MAFTEPADDGQERGQQSAGRHDAAADHDPPAPNYGKSWGLGHRFHGGARRCLLSSRRGKAIGGAGSQAKKALDSFQWAGYNPASGSFQFRMLSED